MTDNTSPIDISSDKMPQLEVWWDAAVCVPVIAITMVADMRGDTDFSPESYSAKFLNRFVDKIGEAMNDDVLREKLQEIMLGWFQAKEKRNATMLLAVTLQAAETIGFDLKLNK